MQATAVLAPGPAPVIAPQSLSYRDHTITTYVHPSDHRYGFSVFAGDVSGRAVTSDLAMRGLATRAEAVAVAKQAVDLATIPGISGLGGFNFKSIGKALSGAGKGVRDNIGVISTVGGAVLTATGVGAPVGMALATAGNVAQGVIDTKAAKKQAEKDQKAAEAAQKKAEAEAATEAAAAAEAEAATPSAVPRAGSKPATKLWPWLVAGGGGILVLGVGLWLALRRRR